MARLERRGLDRSPEGQRLRRRGSGSERQPAQVIGGRLITAKADVKRKTLSSFDGACDRSREGATGVAKQRQSLGSFVSQKPAQDARAQGALERMRAFDRL